MPHNRLNPYKTKGKGDFWATWAHPFAIAFWAYPFLVYHFRYPQMAKKDTSKSMKNLIKTKVKGDFRPLGHFSL